MHGCLSGRQLSELWLTSNKEEQTSAMALRVALDSLKANSVARTAVKAFSIPLT